MARALRRALAAWSGIVSDTTYRLLSEPRCPTSGGRRVLARVFCCLLACTVLCLSADIVCVLAASPRWALALARYCCVYVVLVRLVFQGLANAWFTFVLGLSLYLWKLLRLTSADGVTSAVDCGESALAEKIGG